MTVIARTAVAAALALALAHTASARDKVGVAACDEFLAKFETCVTKMPASAQPGVKPSIDQMRASWKGLVANPQAAAGLEGMCRQIGEQLKASLAQFNCQW